MDYKEADAKLQGRNRESRKVGNHTYVKRRRLYGKEYIAVLLHDTDILEFHPDGTIELSNGGYPTITTHDRMNRFLPAGYRVSGEPLETKRSGPGMSVLWSRELGQAVTLSNNTASITPEGNLMGGSVVQYREDRKREQNEARRPANRARYWLRKARGVFADKTGCHFAPVNGCRWNCDLAGRWNRRQNSVLAAGETEKILKCGCRVYRKTAASARLTVEKIMAEENQTVRSAMLSIYGVERFFLDAKPEVVDTLGDEYQLLSLNFGSWNRVRALKMICPSTKAAYIATVPPQTDKISEALDFMFDTDGYLERIAQAS